MFLCACVPKLCTSKVHRNFFTVKRKFVNNYGNFYTQSFFILRLFNIKFINYFQIRNLPGKILNRKTTIKTKVGVKIGAGLLKIPGAETGREVDGRLVQAEEKQAPRKNKWKWSWTWIVYYVTLVIVAVVTLWDASSLSNTAECWVDFFILKHKPNLEKSVYYATCYWSQIKLSVMQIFCIFLSFLNFNTI